MKKKEKIMIAILVAITVVVIIFAASRKNNKQPANSDIATPGQEQVEPEEKYVTTTEDGTKVNTSEALSTSKTVNDVEFTDIQLTERGGETVLLATVKNNGTTANKLFAVDITLIDDAGQDIVTITGLVAPMEPGETATFETSTTLDYANAYDFRVAPKQKNQAPATPAEPVAEPTETTTPDGTVDTTTSTDAGTTTAAQ